MCTGSCPHYGVNKNMSEFSGVLMSISIEQSFFNFASQKKPDDGPGPCDVRLQWFYFCKNGVF